MDALALYLSAYARERNIADRPRSHGAGDRRKKIIGDGVGDFIFEEDGQAVSSLDIAQALVQFPGELRDGWLDLPSRTDLSLYALDSRNPHISGGRVKVMTFAEAVRRINDRKHRGATLSFGCSREGHQKEVTGRADIFYRNLNQLGKYVMGRFEEPGITARYLFNPMLDTEIVQPIG